MLVDGISVTKTTSQVRADRRIALASEEHQWVGRGALKLLPVLERWKISLQDRVCADLGSSTGGFTEVLLHLGARRVFAIDVGRGGLAWRLRTDPRVVVMEGVNARHLQELPDQVSFISADLSFISIRLILPTIKHLLSPDGEAVLLVKPQFEVKRDRVARGGRVKTEADRTLAIADIRQASTDAGFTVVDGIDSGLAGARSGNIEHLLWVRPAVHHAAG